MTAGPMNSAPLSRRSAGEFKKSSISVKSFADYRIFLIAHAQEMKKRNPAWSYGAWAKRLGLKTTSSITKVIKGQRAPGASVTSGLIRYFEFSREDADYFRDLIELDRVKRDPRLKAIVMERIEAVYPKAAVRILDDQTFSLISRWYCLAVREMTELDRFVEDPKWISRNFRYKVTAREAQDAIDLLLKTGLLVRDGKGRLRTADASINTQSDLASEAIRRFHSQMLGNAEASLETVALEEREFISTSLVVSRERLGEAKKFLREMRAQFVRKFEVKGGDELYQLQLQLFPLTRNHERKSEG